MTGTPQSTVSRIKAVVVNNDEAAIKKLTDPTRKFGRKNVIIDDESKVINDL